MSKLFVRLDTPHTELRLKATFHYIDRWEGASAYARVDSQFVWAESYTLPPAAEGVNLCGGDAPENRFAVAIDAVVPHNSTVANILFGGPRGVRSIRGPGVLAFGLTVRDIVALWWGVIRVGQGVRAVFILRFGHDIA